MMDHSRTVSVRSLLIQRATLTAIEELIVGRILPLGHSANQCIKKRCTSAPFSRHFHFDDRSPVAVTVGVLYDKLIGFRRERLSLPYPQVRITSRIG